MANQEQLDILKQGVKVWNEWREEKNLDVAIDLSDTNLNKADLRNADLDFADLSSADLGGADLGGANLIAADLSHADLSSADLNFAHLGGTNLSHANLSHANLNNSQLVEANLSHANLNHAQLVEVDLSEAIVGWTRFGDVDLSVVKNLETVNHDGPSTIGIDTIYRSQGKIPEVFLKGAGVDDAFITYIRSLVGKLIEYYSCFISYSSKDEAFAKRLYADLQSKNVRCWFAPEDMRIGDKIRARIDEAIRMHDKLMLVLSENSVESAWVEKEVETAFDNERKQNKTVLFPIRLDDCVMNTDQAWAADIRRTRNIGDFTRWKNHDNYEKAFNRLLRDLKSEAQMMET